MLQNILNNKILLVGIIIAGIVLILFVVIKFYRKNSAKKELAMLADDRKREETLDGVLRNSHEKVKMIHDESTPYEVDYAQTTLKDSQTGEKISSRIMIQLVEYNELSARKHMMDLQKAISIGSRQEGNSIVIPDIAEYQCEVFAYNDGAYIRDVGGNGITQLKRGKKQVYAESKGIRLQSNDIIILGKVSFKVTIIK